MCEHNLLHSPAIVPAAPEGDAAAEILYGTACCMLHVIGLKAKKYRTDAVPVPIVVSLRPLFRSLDSPLIS